MTVIELIDRLNKFPADAIVKVPEWCSEAITDIEDVVFVNDGIGMTIKVLPFSH